MSPADRQTIVKKIGYLIRTIELLKQYSPVSVALLSSDGMRRSAIERLLQTAIQTVIDCSRLLVITEDWRKARDEREALVLLQEHGVIDDDLEQRMLRAKGFRNILVHEYIDIDLHQLCTHFPTMVADLASFAEALSMWLAKHERRNSHLPSTRSPRTPSR